MNKFQLPNKYKKVGYILTFLSFALLIAKKFFEELDWLRPILLGFVLLGMLVISLSKDKIEDEFIDSLRSQSYRLAFILVIIYTLIQPITNFIVGYVLNQHQEFESFNYFEILFFMLVVQLLFFYQLKRYNR
ncbi:MAG: hypothetical protein ACPGTO_04140 [Polaribacter sp.]